MSWLDAHRRWTVATVLVVAALLAPVALDRDSFPLSTYPMYASARPTRVDLPTAVGVDAGGATHRLSLALIGASDDPLIVAGELREAIGRGHAGRRCEEIARRLVDAGATAEGGEPLVAVEVVTERRDVVASVRDEDWLLGRSVEARCALDGRP